MTLRVGIISANWGAFAHLPAWRSIKGVEVVGICTSRQATAEAAAERCGIKRAFWDASTMAADPEIDIVDCGTRPNIRRDMVLSALANGKHVYNGIPFAADLDSARVLHEAWKKSNSVAVVDAFSEWVPAISQARSLLDEGYLGTPFGGTCIFNLALFNQPFPEFPYNWFAQKGLGVSAVRNLGSHALHLLVHLFGDIREVVAHDGQLLNEWHFPDGNIVKPETNDFANALLKFENGMVIQLQVSWSATLGRGFALDAFGSNGRILIESPSFPTASDTTLRAGTLDKGKLEAIPPAGGKSADSDVGIDAGFDPQPAYPMALSMAQMARAIRGEGKAHPDFDQAWAVEKVLEAIRRSSGERRWVALEEID